MSFFSSRRPKHVLVSVAFTFFLRVEIGAGYLRFSRYGKSNAFFPVYLHCARACVRAYTRFTGSGQYESFLPCAMSNYEPSSKGRLFQKMKNHITQTEGEGRKNIIFSSRRP